MRTYTHTYAHTRTYTHIHTLLTITLSSADICGSKQIYRIMEDVEMKIWNYNNFKMTKKRQMVMKILKWKTEKFCFKNSLNYLNVRNCWKHNPLKLFGRMLRISHFRLGVISGKCQHFSHNFYNVNFTTEV